MVVVVVLLSLFHSYFREADLIFSFPFWFSYFLFFCFSLFLFLFLFEQIFRSSFFLFLFPLIFSFFLCLLVHFSFILCVCVGFVVEVVVVEWLIFSERVVIVGEADLRKNVR